MSSPATAPHLTPPALELRHLHRRFGGIQAVQDLSLRVSPGETLALIGPNGAGKSTLFALIAGELPPSSGSILMFGRDLHRLPPHLRARRGLARTFQSARVFPGLTVAENVLAALLVAGSPSARPPGRRPSARAPRHRAVREALREVSLASPRRPAATLSQGDRKRLELAMVLAGRPSLLLLDEPTAGMGPAERRSIMTLLMSVASSRSLTVLFSEHHVATVFAHAPRVLVMDRGRLIADACPEAVAADPRVREVYLGAGRELGGPSARGDGRA